MEWGKEEGVYIIVGSNNEEKISEKVSYLLDNSQIAELLQEVTSLK